jgi:hypothetical protein
LVEAHFWIKTFLISANHVWREFISLVSINLRHFFSSCTFVLSTSKVFESRLNRLCTYVCMYVCMYVHNGRMHAKLKNILWRHTRLPDGIVSNQKIPIWTKFGGSFNRKCRYILWPFYDCVVYFMAVWSILWSFGIFCGRLVYFMIVWCILYTWGLKFDPSG